MNGSGDHKISDKIIIYGDDGMGYRERWQNSLQGSRWVTTHTTVESNHTSNTDFFFASKAGKMMDMRTISHPWVFLGRFF